MTTYFQLQNVKMDKTKYVPRRSIGNLFMSHTHCVFMFYGDLVHTVMVFILFILVFT